LTHVDALTLNIERAGQASINMAMHVVATRRLGVPQSNAEAFALLERARTGRLWRCSNRQFSGGAFCRRR
jgi:hypothetical protein